MVDNDQTLEIVLQLIYCSCYGLTQNDLMDLCNIKGTDQIEKDTNWSQIETQLKGYIILRRGLFHFTRDIVREVVQEKYFIDPDNEEAMRRKLVTHFEKLEPGERKDKELVHQSTWLSSRTSPDLL